MYKKLRAEGRADEAFDLLFEAKLAEDPAAYRLLADEIEAGVYSASNWPGGAAGARETAGHIAYAQASYLRTATPAQRLSDLIVHIESNAAYGLAFTLREAWLSERCTHHFLTPIIDADSLQRAVAEAQGRAHRPSPRERRKARCADASLAFALSLEEGRYGKPAQELAADWFNRASIWSPPDRQEADVAYAIRFLDGRIAFPAAKASAEAERHAEELTLLSAAWEGYVPAELAAAKLLLDGRMGEFGLRTEFGPAGEAYALLRLAEAAGTDAGPALDAARARLSPEAREALDAEIPGLRGARPRKGAVAER